MVGPYRAPTEDGVRRNIRAAEEIAAKLWKLKLGAVICPHLNSAFMGGINDGSDGFILAADHEMLKRSDVVLTFGKWERSTGSVIEVRKAREFGTPVIFTELELVGWCRKAAINQCSECDDTGKPLCAGGGNICNHEVH